MGGGAGRVAALTPDVAESQIKAAFLYKFCLYVEWPTNAFDGAESPLRLGVIGAPELAEELARIVAERKINGRALQVVRLGDNAEPDKLHLLFVARAEQPRLAHWLAQTGTRPLLIVSASRHWPSGQQVPPCSAHTRWCMGRVWVGYGLLYHFPLPVGTGLVV